MPDDPGTKIGAYKFGDTLNAWECSAADVEALLLNYKDSWTEDNNLIKYISGDTVKYTFKLKLDEEWNDNPWEFSSEEKEAILAHLEKSSEFTDIKSSTEDWADILEILGSEGAGGYTFELWHLPFWHIGGACVIGALVFLGCYLCHHRCKTNRVGRTTTRTGSNNTQASVEDQYEDSPPENYKGRREWSRRLISGTECDRLNSVSQWKRTPVLHRMLQDIHHENENTPPEVNPTCAEMVTEPTEATETAPVLVPLNFAVIIGSMSVALIIYVSRRFRATKTNELQPL